MSKKILKCIIQAKNVMRLIVVDNMTTYMISNKKTIFQKEKLKISNVFITQSYFAVLEDVRLNCTHFFIMKIPKKREVLIILQILTLKTL